jgi:hypothetical protein
MNNIEKLIASTKINHGGVMATETKTEAIARVIELWAAGLSRMSRLDGNCMIGDCTQQENAIEAENLLKQAEEIAGAVC